MNMTSNKQGNSIVIHLSGRFDAGVVPQFKSWFLSILESGEQYYVMNLAEVDYLDSGGLGCLVASLRRVRDIDGDIRVAALSDKVRKVFELTRMHRVFDIYDDSNAAANSFN